MVTLVKGMSLHGSFLVNDFKRHAVFCVVCFALVEKPWIICFLQLLLRRMLGLSIAAMYVCTEAQLQQKKEFFPPLCQLFSWPQFIVHVRIYIPHQRTRANSAKYYLVNDQRETTSSFFASATAKNKSAISSEYTVKSNVNDPVY